MTNQESDYIRHVLFPERDPLTIYLVIIAFHAGGEAVELEHPQLDDLVREWRPRIKA